MIKIIGFQEWHISAIEKKWIYSGDPELEKHFLAASKSESCCMYTVVIENRPIAILGLTKLWSGVGEIWGIISDNVKEKPVAFHKAVLRMIRLHAEKLNLRRLSLEVRADYPEGLRWAKSLGFEEEGYFKKYGPDGADYKIFARFF
jgi:RimJ/RimL family protein N-acetyltransferase